MKNETRVAKRRAAGFLIKRVMAGEFDGRRIEERQEVFTEILSLSDECSSLKYRISDKRLRRTRDVLFPEYVAHELTESRRRAAVRHLVKQILCGEFDDCDSDTRQTLFKKIGPLPPRLGHLVLQKLWQGVRPEHDQ